MASNYIAQKKRKYKLKEFDLWKKTKFNDEKWILQLLLKLYYCFCQNNNLLQFYNKINIL